MPEEGDNRLSIEERLIEMLKKRACKEFCVTDFLFIRKPISIFQQESVHSWFSLTERHAPFL